MNVIYGGYWTISQFVRINLLGRPLNNDKGFSKIRITIYNSIFCRCFRLQRDWKLENVEKGKDFPLFRSEPGKGGVLLEVVCNFRKDSPVNYCSI